MPQQKKGDLFDSSPEIVEAPASPEESMFGPTTETLPNMMKGLGRTILNLGTLPYQITHAVTHPEQDIMIPAIEQAGQAAAAYGQGQRAEALGHGLAALIPGIGPWAASKGQQIGSGDIAGGLTEAASSLLIPKIGEVAREAPSLATKAGLPQLISRMSEAPIYRSTGTEQIMKAVARQLYSPNMTPQSPPFSGVGGYIYPPGEGGEYIPPQPKTPVPQPPPGPPPGTFVSGKGFTMAKRTPLSPPTVSEAKATAGTSPVALPEGPVPPKQLPEASPRMGGRYLGQEGGLGPQPHVDVVASRPMLVRDLKSGRFRYETINEMKGRLTNLGKGVTRQPSAEAKPYVPPKPPPRSKP